MKTFQLIALILFILAILGFIGNFFLIYHYPDTGKWRLDAVFMSSMFLTWGIKSLLSWIEKKKATQKNKTLDPKRV